MFGDQVPPIFDYKKKDHKETKNLSVLLFQFQSTLDMDKWDLAIWALCRKSIAVTQR